ncbi:C-type lectin domain family 2 member L-like isoform X3 [Gopherus evgoodei]|uniref:C-type lectin domain family 2 member L-like n=1 Tax=Gopherus evgoodei TaxID=1825980 RepID=A0A8C4Y7G0_9SAUR|nr:C-type lectin domain family 2 member L-like isoform X3 [Gopherus evgoodei]
MEPAWAQREGAGGISPRSMSGAAGDLLGEQGERAPLTSTTPPGTPEDRSSPCTQWAPGTDSEPQVRSASGDRSPVCDPVTGRPSLPSNATFWIRTLSGCRELFSRVKEAVSGLFSCQNHVAGTVSVAVVILLLVLVIFLIVWYFSYKEPPITLPFEPCPEDWLYFKRKCYYLSEKEEDWDSSQSFCSLYEASLAVIENHQEMHFLTKRMHMQDSWIGLRKREEGFYWVNGIPLTTDMFHIQDHEECAYTDSSSISTSACSLPRHWICSRHPFK